MPWKWPTLTHSVRPTRRLDTSGWSVPEQVDWHLVRAEMNGMLYHLAVLWRASGVEFEEIAAELASRRPPA